MFSAAISMLRKAEPTSNNTIVSQVSVVLALVLAVSAIVVVNVKAHQESTRRNAMTATFVDSSWLDGVVELMITINASQGKAIWRHPKRVWEVDDIVEIGKELMGNVYNPADWFDTAQALATPSISLHEMPAFTIDRKYKVLSLAAVDQFGKFVSMRFGGIVFEDPFYFLLACKNISQLRGHSKGLYVLPTVESKQAAWKQRAIILKQLQMRSYQPFDFFAECDPIGQQPLPPLASFDITGSQLAELRDVGGANLHDKVGLGKFVMYAFR